MFAAIAVVGVAVVKPWGAPPAPTPRLIEATAAPSLGEVIPSPTPGPVDPLGTVHGLDWPAIGSALRPHDAWGIRSIVYDNVAKTVRERWTPARQSESDVAASDNGAERYALVPAQGVVVALGLTTPLAELPLDVRAWRDVSPQGNVQPGWRNVPFSAVTPIGDPFARLLLATPAWSGGGAWPDGSYQFDALLDSGVQHTHVWLGQGEGPAPARPDARAQQPLATFEGMASTPGAFIVSGVGSSSYLFVGLPTAADRHDEASSWLSVDLVDHAPALTGMLAPLDGAASLIGAAIPAGEAFEGATLTQIAPIAHGFGSARLIGAPASDGGHRPTVAVFDAPDATSGFPTGIYRIDGVVRRLGADVEMSWDVPLIERPSNTASPLLDAIRRWASTDAHDWHVLLPGRTIPAMAFNGPEPPSIGGDCAGGSAVSAGTAYLGLAHPGGRFRAVRVRTYAGARSSDVPVQTTQLVPGIVAIQPLAGRWAGGNYAIAMERSSGTQTVIICAR